MSKMSDIKEELNQELDRARYIMNRETFWPDTQACVNLSRRIISLEEKMDKILFLLDGNYLIEGKWVSRNEILSGEKDIVGMLSKGDGHAVQD